MLLRLLCSVKTFLNYVTGVYMYLKVTGGIGDSQPHFAFQHLACGRHLFRYWTSLALYL